jgi:antitoxin component of MazEF toxin-antitoxin module
MPAELGRVRRIGATLHITIPRSLERLICIGKGDRVAIRVAGEKLVIERIEMEKLAVLRTGEAASR